MFRLAAVLVAVAWAFSGWRNMPRLAQPYAAGAGLCIASCILLAYWLGTRHASSKVVAAAVARAEAHAHAHATSQSRADARMFVVVNQAEGARVQGEVEFGQTPEWIVGPKHAAIDEETMANYVSDTVADIEGIEA